MLPVARPQVAVVSSEVLSRYVGAYEVSNRDGRPGLVVTTVSNGKLFWNENESGQIEMIPLSETGFLLNGSSVEFLRDESGAYNRFRHTSLDEQVEGKRK